MSNQTYIKIKDTDLFLKNEKLITRGELFKMIFTGDNGTIEADNRVLCQGDNLYFLRDLPDNTFDMIYADPPFNSNRNYAAPAGTAAEGIAFDDLWTLDQIKEELYSLLDQKIPAVHSVIAAAEHIHSKSMKAYLIMMAARLFECHRVLKKTGTIYLHCDDAAGHYLKLLMDGIFGQKNFRNEIVWHRNKSSKNVSKNLPRNVDYILRYTKSNNYIFNKNTICIPYSEEHKDKYFPYVEEGTQRRFASCKLDLTTFGGHEYKFRGFTKKWMWSKERMLLAEKQGIIYQPKPTTIPRYKKYLDSSEGSIMDNIWSDIEEKGGGKKNEGYPTQKPNKLIERLVNLSTNKGDKILDPFVGSGTIPIVAEKNSLRWVGIDVSPKTIEFIKKRLKKLNLSEDLLDVVYGEIQIVKRNSKKIYSLRKPKDIKEIPKNIDFKKKIDPKDKEKLYGKQEGKCNNPECNTFFHMRNLTADRIDSSIEGYSNIENLQLLCHHCNSVKGDRTNEYLIRKTIENRNKEDF